MVENTTVAVIGLGYVGLPLAIAFGAKFRTLGFDISESKIRDYRRKRDKTGEVTSAEFDRAARLEFHSDPTVLKDAQFLIVAVPTPVDAAHVPDLGPLESASAIVGRHLRLGATVVFESTVFPGATEEVCVPILERESGLKWSKDFTVGYSPERINPGDKEHTLTKITKVVSGDSPQTLERVAQVYGAVIEAGVYRAPSIKTAEAAKVIENTQRDLNIALMNELAIIFNRMNIDTAEVIKAASTKWNFLPFKPGLVGGHCIGVDPYYLTYKAEQIGYHPQVILAGRRINDGMAAHIALQVSKMIGRDRVAEGPPAVAVLGITFKENCADVRNSKVVDLVHELQDFGFSVLVHDPVADAAEVQHEYGLRLLEWSEVSRVDALVLAVPHAEFLSRSFAELAACLRPSGLVVDVKSVLDPEQISKRGMRLWRL